MTNCEAMLAGVFTLFTAIRGSTSTSVFKVDVTGPAGGLIGPARAALANRQTNPDATRSIPPATSRAATARYEPAAALHERKYANSAMSQALQSVSSAQRDAPPTNE
ncbi:hypothetical protein LBMAG48_01700 [Phycisphaerae bacterium]|nr:hypothetical protein LBMAG48_01700 [Phycisphaerae bacterium]